VDGENADTREPLLAALTEDGARWRVENVAMVDKIAQRLDGVSQTRGAAPAAPGALSSRANQPKRVTPILKQAQSESRDDWSAALAARGRGRREEWTMRKRDLLLATLAIAVVVAAIGVGLYALHTRAQTNLPAYPGLNGPFAVVCPGPPNLVADQGTPGVRPRNDCTPSFTQQDVRDYLARGVDLDKVGFVRRPPVTRVVFLTIADLGRATGDSEWAANYPTDLVVCYAQFSGTFTISAPSGFTKTVHVAYIVFDGHTGNQLVDGVGVSGLLG
jgi:hypothetical protein